jgi:hypothetical protein
MKRCIFKEGRAEWSNRIMRSMTRWKHCNFSAWPQRVTGVHFCERVCEVQIKIWLLVMYYFWNVVVCGCVFYQHLEGFKVADQVRLSLAKLSAIGLSWRQEASSPPVVRMMRSWIVIIRGRYLHLEKLQMPYAPCTNESTNKSPNESCRRRVFLNKYGSMPR